MGAEGRRWYAVPFRVIPDLGQVSKYLSESETKVAWHVLQQCITGSKYAKALGEEGPEVSWIVASGSMAGDAEGLAGVASGHKVGSLHGCPVDVTNVS